MLWHWYIWTLFFTHLLQLCWGACSRALMDRQSQGKKRLQRSILQSRVYSYWLVGMQANTRVLGNGNKTRIGNKSEWQDMSCFAFQSCHISSTHSALSFTWRIKLLLHNMSVIQVPRKDQNWQNVSSSINSFPHPHNVMSLPTHLFLLKKYIWAFFFKKTNKNNTMIALWLMYICSSHEYSCQACECLS